MAKKQTPKAKAKAKSKLKKFRRAYAAASTSDESPHARNYGKTNRYTMADEARQTGGRRRFGGVDARLRDKPVIFISAGFMNPKDFDMTKQPPLPEKSVADVANPVVAKDQTPEPAVSVPCTQLPVPSSVTPHKPVSPCDNPPDGESDADSDSSTEVILFRGRNADPLPLPKAAPKPTQAKEGKSDSTGPSQAKPQSPLTNCPAVKPVIPEPAAKPKERNAKPKERDYISFNASESEAGQDSDENDDDDDDDDDAIIADYIANMLSNFDDDDDEEEEDEQANRLGLGSHSFSVLRDLGGTDSDAVPSPGSSDDESEDGMDEEDEDDEASEARQVESDARLARKLAKQEELGLNDDDDVLFDGLDSYDTWEPAPRAPRQRKGKKKAASKRSGLFENGIQYPAFSATRMAAAFDELDLMDIQNTRIQRSKKGLISFNLSDSELEDALNKTIKKDRLKKAEKKKAREVARSQGLLGKNVDPDDLRVKYLDGMSIDELAEEFENFLLGKQEQLTLPPLDKGARKIIHMIANMFQIKSKSSGYGSERYTVLYRSKATRPYNADLLDKTISRVQRSWFPRVDVPDLKDTRRVESNALKRAARAEIRANKPRSKYAVGLREGEKVGQHAAEIGAENKGRAMLEKMGWTKGMALGNVENGGLMVPLTHVVKKSKAGLGEA